MKQQIYLLCLIASFMFNGCSKDEDPQPTPPVAPIAEFTYSGAGVALQLSLLQMLQ
ncbi:MAG: hypothetical protein IPP71_08230 [Bacteroidetes bacterium]|nr:hypothetical protein [Bacteroidota bacterium]